MQNNIPADHYDVIRKICHNPYIINHTQHTWENIKAALVTKQTEYTVGWNHDKNGWWYADTKTTCYKSCWRMINGHKYRFNSDDYALTGWQVIEGKWYYFEPRVGHPLECATYVTDSAGAQSIGEY